MPAMPLSTGVTSFCSGVIDYMGMNPNAEKKGKFKKMTERLCAPLSEIPKALEKTGFPLEFSVADDFRKAGWEVIGSRYYIDDFDGRARELDLVSYRIIKTDDIDICTVILISCKKDAENTWAFLSTEKPSEDANVDWEPVHHWTDFEPLSSYLSNSDWKVQYLHENNSIFDTVFRTTRNIFASQLVSSDGKSPKNDKPIFDSITGLLKALDHEILALPNRMKGQKRIYLFTLATIVDAPMVDVQYKQNETKAIEIHRLSHLARFMVRKREVAALIHFVRKDKTGEFIQQMSLLADHNAEHIKSAVVKSFEAVRTNKKVQEYFSKKLESRLKFRINRKIEELGIQDEMTKLQLSYTNNCLSIELDVESETANTLNSHEPTRELVQKELAEIVRYKGKFLVDWDIFF